MQTYYETNIPGLLQLPQINSNLHAETQLEQILASHEEQAHIGNRFLVGRLQNQITLEGHRYPDTVFYDYILTRTETGWAHQCAIYITETPYHYDFDVFEMRPFLELGSVLTY